MQVPPKYHFNFFSLKTCTIKSDQDGSYPFSVKVKILTAEFSKRKKNENNNNNKKLYFYAMYCYIYASMTLQSWKANIKVVNSV